MPGLNAWPQPQADPWLDPWLNPWLDPWLNPWLALWPRPPENTRGIPWQLAALPRRGAASAGALPVSGLARVSLRFASFAIVILRVGAGCH